jgi:hypothetical protein
MEYTWNIALCHDENVVSKSTEEVTLHIFGRYLLQTSTGTPGMLTQVFYAIVSPSCWDILNMTTAAFFKFVFSLNIHSHPIILRCLVRVTEQVHTTSIRVWCHGFRMNGWLVVYIGVGIVQRQSSFVIFGISNGRNNYWQFSEYFSIILASLSKKRVVNS